MGNMHLPRGWEKGGDSLPRPLSKSVPGSWKCLGIEFELHTHLSVIGFLLQC